MQKHNFTEDDKQKLINFLNMVAEKAKFEFNTSEALTYCKLLAHMQQAILPKVSGHILEITKLVEPEEPVKAKPKPKARKKQ